MTPSIGGRTRVGLLAGGLLAMAASGVFFPADRATLILAYPVVALAALAMLVATLGVSHRVPGALVYLGRISYGLYVFHMLAITITRAHIHLAPAAIEWAVQFTSALALTMLFASVSYYVLETPFLRLKERFSRLERPATVFAQEESYG